MSLLRKELLSEAAMNIVDSGVTDEEEILDILESTIGPYIDRLMQYEGDIAEFRW